MKLKDLEAECIRFVAQSDDVINADVIKAFNDATDTSSANYQSFIVNAIPEINRAILEIVPTKRLDMAYYKETNPFENCNGIIATIILPKNVYDIFKVLFYGEDGITHQLTYRKVDKDEIQIHNLMKKGQLVVKYYPTLANLFTKSDKEKDLSEYCINDLLCMNVIPYFVKYHLWQEIEPELAQVIYQRGMQNLQTINEANFQEPYQENVDISGWCLE